MISMPRNISDYTQVFRLKRLDEAGVFPHEIYSTFLYAVYKTLIFIDFSSLNTIIHATLPVSQYFYDIFMNRIIYFT